MKAEYFVVVFCLLFAGAYFTYAKRTGGWGNNDSSIVISSDNFYEEIKYAGKINFTDDETSFKSISPGGYINFRKNEERVIAKSNKQGVISYELSEGDNKLKLDSNGRKLITEAVKEMIALGIDADERMERIYNKGGNRALMNELANLKNDNVKRMYFEHILKSDSLSAADLTEMAKKIATSFGSDQDKEEVLKRFTVEHLKDSLTADAYMKTVESFNDDYAKSNALKNIMALPVTKQLFPQIMHAINGLHDENEKGSLLRDMIDKAQCDEEQTDQIIEATGRFNDEMQKENLLMQLIGKKDLPEKHFGKLLEMISHFNDDNQKENLYRKLMGENNLSEEQWISLINQAANVSGDFEKSNFLIQLSLKMPKGDNIRNAYLKIAKTITDDGQYGRALRAVE
jgi:hypothetical protein